MRKQGSVEISSKRLVEDFNILLASTYDDETLFQKMEKEKIEQQYCRDLLKDPKGQRYDIKCNADEFKVFGSGIYLLFKFLKLIVIIFFSLSTIQFAMAIIFLKGDEISSISKQSESFLVRMAKTTLGNSDQNHQLIGSILYFVVIFLFSISIIYWKQSQEAEVISCSQKRLLPSYYTVILDPVPQGYSQLELKSYLNQHYGEVKEIFSAKQFHNDLLHYQQIDQIVRQFKIEFFSLKKERENKNSLKLISLFREFYFHYLRMKSHKRDRYQPAFAFITFKQISSRQRILADVEEYKNCLRNSQIEETDGIINKLNIRHCNMEPDGISWENVTLPTKNIIFRFIFQIALLFFVLVISIFVIFLFALADYNLTNPSYSNFTVEEIKKMNSTIAIKYYCLSLSFSQFYSTQMCSDYTGQSAKIICLQIALPIMISLLKFLFTELMKALVGVRRHPTQIKKYESQIVITFIFFFVVSGLLQLVINLEIKSNQHSYSIKRLFETTFKPIYDIFPTDSEIILPNDFSREWYLWNSSKVILITLLSFNFTSIFNVLYSIIRKQIILFMASKKQTLLEAKQVLKGQKLQIQFIYAFLLNVIYFSLLYGAVIPLVWVFCSFSLLLLYWSHKYIFTRYCQNPLMFGHSINHLIVRMILFGIVFSTFIYPLILGGKKQMSIGQRYITYLYYPILGGVILIYMFCKKIMLRLFIRIKHYCQGKFNIRNARLPSLICNIESDSNELHSYSMHQNKLYSSTLKVLYTINSTERNRATFLLNQQLSNFFQSLKSEKGDSKNYFQEFVHLIKQDRNRFNKKYFSKSRLNPFGQSQKKVKQIFKIYNQINKNSFSRPREKGRFNAKYHLSQMKSYELQDRIIEKENEDKIQKEKNSDQNIESQRGFSQILK